MTPSDFLAALESVLQHRHVSFSRAAVAFDESRWESITDDRDIAALVLHPISVPSDQGPEINSTSKYPRPFNATFTCSMLNLFFSLTAKVTIRLRRSAVAESCSSHGRVASASRTRRTQLSAQYMRGILSSTIGRFEAAPVRSFLALGCGGK